MIYCTLGELANHYTTDTVLLSGEIWVVKQIFLERKHQNCMIYLFFICVHPPKGQRNSISTYHRIINKITSIQILFLSRVTFFSRNSITKTFLVATLSLYMQKKKKKKI